MNKMRQEMIDAFLAALQEDRIPWHRTWTAIQASVPRNAVKDTEYRGVNRFWLLHMAERNGYSDPRWCTYKQAKDNGYQVRKGEKGTHVEFWSLYDRKTKTKISEAEADILRQELSPEEYAERIKPVANTYTVFNAEQIEGIPKLPEEAVKTYELDEGGLVQMRETLLENMGVLFQEGGEKAFYRPSEDCIHLPEIRRFESEYDYMATLLHEAGHATGHEGRLHRPTSVEFGTPSYAKEELRAEIASAFTAQTLRLSQSGSHMDNHKAYIQSWIKILKNEPDELFRAIRDAEKISDYLIDKGEFNLTRERSEIWEGVEKEREQDSEEKRDVPKVESKETAAAGMTVEEYAVNGYEPYAAELPDPSVTVSEMTWEQQEEIRLGQENGLDVGVYANPKFTADQMNEIRKGLENGVDVSFYANPDLNALQMNEIRHGLEKGENIMKTDQKAAILGYYSGVDGSQYMLYKMGDPEKEYLTNGEKQWDDPADIKPILAQLKQIPHLTDRELIMGQLQQNDPYAPITRHMQEIVGEVSFSTNRTVGEVIQFTDAQEYLKTVEEEIEYQSSSGFGYRTFTDDPETRKGIDDIVYDMYGERNPHDLDYYRDLHDSSDKKKMTIEEIYQSMTPEKQEQFDANRDYGDMEAVKRLIEEQRQELQQGQERKQERSRTHGTI